MATHAGHRSKRCIFALLLVVLFQNQLLQLANAVTYTGYIPHFLLLVGTVAASTPPANDLYSTLSVPKNASQKDITKAYRKLALKYHPDKVTPEERPKAEKKFKEIGHAHDILSDESKRKRYDLYGHQGLDDSFQPGAAGNGNGGFGGMNMNDIFQMSQGMGSNGGRAFRGFSRDGRAGGEGFHIDLSEILQGFMGGRHPSGNSGMFGSGLGGAGFNSMGMDGMGGINGMGMNNPMFDQQQQQRAPKYSNLSPPQVQQFFCTLSELSDINGCVKKMKVSLEGGLEKIYTINVQPGWKDGTKIKFKATKDGMFPPMTFILKEKKHKYLVRDGDDLIYHCTVTSRQAKRGAKIKVPLPDGEIIEIETQPDEIMKGYEKSILGKGMPTKKGSTSQNRGHFIVKFRIKEVS